MKVLGEGDGLAPPAELSAAVIPAERGLVWDVRPWDLSACFKPVEETRVCLSGSANQLLNTVTGCWFIQQPVSLGGTKGEVLFCPISYVTL